jgi:hypothetical protein
LLIRTFKVSIIQFYKQRAGLVFYNILFAALFLFSIKPVYSQSAQLEWLARYDGNPGFDDYATCMAIDGSNNIYIGGSQVTASGINDMIILKYTSSGQLLWNRTFNGANSLRDEAVKIAFCPSTSSIIVTGFTEYQNNCFDIVTQKYSVQGELEWTQLYHYPSSLSNKPKGLKIDGSGNIYITGFTSAVNSDFLTIKYDPNSKLLWADIYSGILNNSIDDADNISISGSGNVYVTGSSSGNPQILLSLDIVTIKYSSNGIRQWIARYDGAMNKNDEPADLIVDSRENVYIAGKSQIDGSNSDYEYLVIKYNSSVGAVQWTDHYRGYSSSEGTALTIDDQNCIYVTGSTLTQSQSTDFLTVKYNQAGERVWMSFFNNIYNNWDIPEAIAVDNFHNVYVTGKGGGISPLYSDYNTVKYNPSGIQQWAMNYDAALSDCPADLKIDNNDNVYVTGWSTLNQQDIVTIKYSQLTGIDPVSNENPEQYKLYNNYPNPFNPSTKINFALPKSSHVTITVYDAMGHRVEEIVNSGFNPGTYDVTWDGSAYSSGVYFYKLIADGFVETKKMLLVK